MSGQLDLIDLGTYSPKEARMIATALALQGVREAGQARISDDRPQAYANVAREYRDLAAKVDQRRGL